MRTSTQSTATTTTLDTQHDSLVRGVEDFWELVSAAQHVVLMLDYDGTLAPFNVDRMRAQPLPGVLGAVHAIDGDETVSLVLVSGRPVAEIQALLGETGLTVVGSHGYEMYTRGSGLREMPVSDEQHALLDAAFNHVTRVFPAERVERKVASVAVHFRGLETQDYIDVEAEIATAWQAPGGTAITELRAFNGGLELRAIGRSKGTAVGEILAGTPRDALAIYVGDDETDEDAFAALPPSGIGIKVGSPEVATHAKGRLDDCAAVEQLLCEWSARREST